MTRTQLENLIKGLRNDVINRVNVEFDKNDMLGCELNQDIDKSLDEFFKICLSDYIMINYIECKIPTPVR